MSISCSPRVRPHRSSLKSKRTDIAGFALHTHRLQLQALRLLRSCALTTAGDVQPAKPGGSMLHKAPLVQVMGSSPQLLQPLVTSSLLLGDTVDAAVSANASTYQATAVSRLAIVLSVPRTRTRNLERLHWTFPTFLWARIIA